MPARQSGHRFRFVVLGRYPAHLKDNATAVTLNVSSGDLQGHLVHCGTLTMSEAEWDSLREALRKSIGDGLEVEDLGPDRP